MSNLEPEQIGPVTVLAVAVLLALAAGSSGFKAFHWSGLDTSDIVTDEQKISDTAGNFTGGLADGDRLGTATAWLGDLDGDGVADLAVGAPLDDTGGSDRGAVWILLMNENGTAASSQKIAQSTGGFGGSLGDGDRFGTGLAALEDLDGDNVTDLAVGAPRAGGGAAKGQVWVLFLNADGTVASQSLLEGKNANGNKDGRWGTDVAALGDLDGDGTRELAVGVPELKKKGQETGGVDVVSVDSSGNLVSADLLGPATDPDAGDRFGESVADVGDLDGDNVTDLAVGVPRSDDGGTDRGAVRLFLLATDGSAKSDHSTISSTSGGFGGSLSDGDRLGSGLAAVDDMDADGVQEIAAGAPGTDDGGLTDSGATWVLFLNADGTVGTEQKISESAGGFEGSLGAGDLMGTGVGAASDLDGDGEPDLSLGAPGTDDGGPDRGATWVAFLDDVDNNAPTADFTYSPSDPNTGQTVDFTDQSTDSDGTVSDWSWDFGDGATSTKQNPSHAYADAGDYTVTLTVTDDDGDSDTTSQTITVNDPPVAEDDSATTDEDTPVWVAVLENDTDPEGDTLSVTSVTDPDHGTASLPGNGTVKYEPDADHDGDDTFDYTVSDGNGGSDTASVNVTIDPVDDPPSAADDSASTDVDTTVWVDVLENDTDVDGDTLSVTSVTDPDHGTATVEDNDTIKYDPDLAFTGGDSFDYTVTDGTLNDTATVNVTVSNDAPSASDDSATTDEDTPVWVIVLENDLDPDGDTLSVTSVTDPDHGTATVEDNDTIRYDPDPDYDGPDSFDYTISDGLLTDTATVEVAVEAVNDAPLAEDDSATTDEDTPVWVIVLENDLDPDGDTLDVDSVSDPAHGTATIEENDTIRYDPDPDYNGDDSFTYTVTDGVLEATATVDVTVDPVNDAPVASDDSASTERNTKVWVDVLSNDTDVDDVLDVLSASDPPEGTTEVEANGTIEYDPDPGFTGDDSFDYTVTDGNLTATATVSITVNPPNLAPNAGDDSATTDEDHPVWENVLSNDNDPNGDTLSVESVSDPDHGTATIEENDTIRYDPDPDYNGDDSFTYTVTDGSLIDNATVGVTVDPVNDAPVAADDSATTDEDTPVWVDVRENDDDVDEDALSVTSATDPDHGTATVEDNDTIRYDPDPDYDGPDSFDYTVTDGLLNDTAAVEVTVEAVNDAPVAADDAVVTDEDESVWVDVLGNDTDVDGDALSVASASDPAHGTVAVPGNGTVEYTPDPGFAGEDTFDYTASDGGLSSEAKVSVEVQAAPGGGGGGSSGGSCDCIEDHPGRRGLDITGTVTLATTGNLVVFEWPEISLAAGYQVWRQEIVGDDGWDLAAEVAEPSYGTSLPSSTGEGFRLKVTWYSTPQGQERVREGESPADVLGWDPSVTVEVRPAHDGAAGSGPDSGPDEAGAEPDGGETDGTDDGGDDGAGAGEAGSEGPGETTDTETSTERGAGDPPGDVREGEADGEAGGGEGTSLVGRISARAPVGSPVLVALAVLAAVLVVVPRAMARGRAGPAGGLRGGAATKEAPDPGTISDPGWDPASSPASATASLARIEQGLEASAPPPDPTELTYLVVDDSLTSRHMIEVMLKQQGIPQDRIYPAESAREAIEKFKQHRPDVALLDVEMPGRDGHEVARDLHAMAPETCIVLVTSLDGGDERVRVTLEDIPIDHVVKPVRPGDILPVVEAQLDRIHDATSGPGADGDRGPSDPSRSQPR